MSKPRIQPRWLLGAALALALLLLLALLLPAVRELVLPPSLDAPARSGEDDGALAQEELALVGWVEDAETGARLEGAVVLLRRGQQTLQAQADAQGEFVFRGLDPGAWSVEARAEGFLPDLEPRRVELGTRPLRGVEVLAWPVGTLRGSLSAHGEPVQGAALSLLRPQEDGEELEEPLEVVSDAKGRFEVQVRAGSLRLRAQVSGLEAQSSQLVRLVGGGQQELRLDLTPRGSLRVRVVDEQGEPVRGARVELLGTPGRRLARDSDASGEALLEQVPAGQVRARVWAARYSPLETALVPVEPEQEARLEVVLPPLRTVMGQVVDPDGKGVAGAKVSLHPEGQPGSVTSINAGRAGEFRFKELEQGRYLVQARHFKFSPSVEVRVDASQEELVRLELRRGGSIEGEVVLGGGGVPESFSVTVDSYETEEGVEEERRMWPLKVDGGDGSFVLADLSPGIYGLHVDAPGHGYGVSRGIRVTAGGRSTGVQIRIDGGALLSGRVVDARTREPVAGAQVVIRDQERRERMLGALSAQTDGNGDFFFEGVAPGRRSLSISKQGYTSRIVAGVTLSDHRDEDRVITLEALGEGEKPKVEFFGIGASLEKTKSGALKITRIIEGGPASGNGLRAGDELLSINGDPASEMELGRAIDLIRGEEGTALTLRLRRPGEPEPREITLQRGRVVYENHPGGARRHGGPEKRAGEQ